MIFYYHKISCCRNDNKKGGKARKRLPDRVPGTPVATVKCECEGKNGAQEKKRYELQTMLEKHKGKKGSLIPALQEIQNHYGYLKKEALEEVSKSLQLSLAHVYGVATFYAQFHLKPRGRWVIRVCLGTACHVRGAEKIMQKVKEKLMIGPGETTEDLRFTIEPVACIGCCGLAPVMMINDNTHGRLKPDEIRKILDMYE